MSKTLHQKIRQWVQWIERFTDRYWYGPLIALLAALDNYIIVVPTDGILISSVMITPKRWILFSLCIALGSTLGAWGLSALVEIKGLPWILEIYPGLDQTQTWLWTKEFFDSYGLFVVFFVAVTPLMQQPAVILASLADTSLTKLVLVVLTGRTIKYLIMGWVASHAPRLLKKMWGVKDELEEVGVQLK